MINIWLLAIAFVLIFSLITWLVNKSEKSGAKEERLKKTEGVVDEYKKAEKVANKPAPNNVDDLIRRL